jgi:DNA-binding beta-propeller fold protein YncE
MLIDDDRPSRLTYALLAGLMLIGQAVFADPGAGYKVGGHWAIGGDGRWDYLTVEAPAHRLYVARETRVAVIDMASGQAVGEIADTPGAHGIAIAADVGRGYATAGNADAVKVFDLKTLRTVAAVPVGAKPDAILYERSTRKVVALNGRGHSASVIDVLSNAVVGTIALPGAPEEARSDGAGHVLVNIEDKNELVALDLQTLRVRARWLLTGCDGPSGLALDSAHHRSFSACSNAALVVSDTEAGKALTALPIGKGVDGAEFDPAFGNAYTSNGDGSLTIVHESDPDHFVVAGTLPTAKGARTIALDPLTHRLYLPTAQFGPPGPPGADGRVRPSLVPGTFEVLVVFPPGSTAH